MQSLISLSQLVSTLIIVISVTTACSAPIRPVISFYPHPDFKGHRLDVLLNTNECYKLEGEFQNDYFSSIKIPNGICIQLFSDTGCRGILNPVLSKDHDSFQALGINDQVTSFRRVRCWTNEMEGLSLSVSQPSGFVDIY